MPANQGDKIRVMVIEDNRDMLEIYRSMFEDDSCYEATLFSDAMRGLRELESRNFDVIVLDIIMEPLTGESFFVYLRGNEKTVGLPVVVVSVLEPGSLAALEKLNHSVILQKPIRKDDLFGAIDRCLELYARP